MAKKFLSPNVHIYIAVHALKASEHITKTDGQTRYIITTKPVIVGDNVWIGGNFGILSWILIGVNIPIEAKSVVTNSVLNNVLAFGSSCKIRKKL